MPRDLFGDVVRPFNGAGARSRYTVPLSMAAHTCVVVVAVVAPLLASDALPALTTRLTFESVTPIVPPEPPRPRITRPADTPAVDPGLAPTEAPQGFTPEPETLADPGGDVDGAVITGIETNADAVLAPPPPPPPPAQETRTARAGVEVKPPAKIRDAAPVYPAIAQSARISGVVIIQATIGVDGAVIDATVLRSVPLLDQAALDAVRQWRYTPSRLNGQPVAVVMTVTVNFQLR
jgi:protein TonB